MMAYYVSVHLTVKVETPVDERVVADFVRDKLEVLIGANARMTVRDANGVAMRPELVVTNADVADDQIGYEGWG